MTAAISVRETRATSRGGSLHTALEQRLQAAAEAGDAANRRDGQAQKFVEERRQRFEQLEHRLDACFYMAVAGDSARLELGGAFAQDCEGRIDLAGLSCLDQDREHPPNIGDRFKMLAAVAEDVDRTHDAPPTQL